MESIKRPSQSKTGQRLLGEHLLKSGFLKSDQLEEAIEYQCIYGGKLGTSLIELGFVSEDQLAKTLSQQLKLHYIRPERLMEVPESLLSLIPSDIAQKYLVVPYRKNGKKLYLAAADPAKLEPVPLPADCDIIPLAIPEIRLMMALKHHYGMALPPRFETLAAQINRRELAQQKISNKNQQEPPSTAQNLIDDTAWPLLGDEDYAGEEMTAEDSFSVKFTAAEETYNKLVQQLADAKTRDDLATSISHYLSKFFPVCALLIVRDGTASGWMATGQKSRERFDDIKIMLEEPSIFNLAAAAESHYLGPVFDSPQNQKILQFFDPQSPADALVFPIIVKDHLISFLYLQGEIKNLEKHLAEIKNITHKTEMAFLLLILRNKILTI
jgi:hypothetical protein